jgi:DNA (cytosine-5)-methyltransferase 1
VSAPEIARCVATREGTSQDWETTTMVAAFAQNQREEVRELGVAGAIASIRRGDAKNETLLAFSAKDSGSDAGELAPTLRAGGHTGSHANAGVMPAIAFGWQNSSQQGASVTPTLDKSKVPGIGSAMQVRRLTPRECERLQGFPDDYTLIPYRGKVSADGPRYKALGNSMAVPVVRWIGERIVSVSVQDKEKA